MSASDIVINYIGWGCQSPNPRKYTVLNGNFVFNLCELFKEHNLGAKSDLPSLNLALSKHVKTSNLHEKLNKYRFYPYWFKKKKKSKWPCCLPTNTDRITEDWLQLAQIFCWLSRGYPLFSQVPEWIHLNLSSITIIMTLITKMMCIFFFHRHPIHKRIRGLII